MNEIEKYEQLIGFVWETLTHRIYTTMSHYAPQSPSKLTSTAKSRRTGALVPLLGTLHALYAHTVSMLHPATPLYLEAAV